MRSFALAFGLLVASLLACAHITTAGKVTPLPTTPEQMTVLLPAVANVARAHGLKPTVANYRVAVTLADGATIAWYVVGTETLMAVDAPPIEQSKVEASLAAAQATAKELWNQAVMQCVDAGT